VDPVTLPSLFLAIFIWVGYFSVVVFICHTLYMKLRGEAPKSPNLTVMIDGKSVSALAEWEARDKRLQRAMIALAALLVLLPLFLPWLLQKR
jgi:preprotein translocase subunit SecG